MPIELVAAALGMAVQQREPAPGLLLHMDRGSQYAGLSTRHYWINMEFAAA